MPPFIILWKQFPFLRILPALTGGILTAAAFPIALTKWIWGVPLLLLLISLRLKGTKWPDILALHLLLFFAGILLCVGRQPPDVTIGDQLWEGIATVESHPSERRRSVRVMLRLMGEPGLKALLYLEKDDRALQLLPGDRIILSARLKRVPPPDFPGTFHYARYLRNKRCYFTGYSSARHWMLLPENHGVSIRRKLAVLQKNFAGTLYSRLPEPADGLVTAMLLGDKSLIDPETTTAFSKTGIMHMLAVSGLHVSIIYLIVSSLHLPFSRRRPKWAYCTTVLELSSIWAFAVITGFGPSVQRAALMFSLFSIGKLAGTRSNALNITAASAALVLIIQPGMLYAPGFQLSYGAVFGILLIYPALSHLFFFKNSLLQRIWQLEVVSFAAVAGTTPMAVYYFGQWPLLFPVSNLMAIPSAFLLVGGGLMLIVFHRIFWAAELLGFVLDNTCRMLVWSMNWLSGRDWSTIQDIPLSLSGTFLLLLLIAATIWLLYYPVHRRRNATLLWLSTLLLFILLRSTERWQAMQSRNTYLSRNGEVLLIHRGDHLYHLTLEGAEDVYAPSLEGHKRLNGIRSEERLPISEEQRNKLLYKLSVTKNAEHPLWRNTPVPAAPH